MENRARQVVEDMNYPVKETLVAFMMITMIGLLAGLVMSDFEFTIKYYIGAGILMAMMAIFGIYVFLDKVYRPMKAYQTTYGSCGLGDKWKAERHKETKQHEKQIKVHQYPLPSFTEISQMETIPDPPIVKIREENAEKKQLSMHDHIDAIINKA